jgi:hypothetical protein
LNAEISLCRKLIYASVLTIGYLVLLEGAALIAEKAGFESLEINPAAIDIEIPPKEEGTYRVFFFGGSTVAEHPSMAYGLVRQTRFWLNNANREVPLEVVNLAAPGHPSDFVRQRVEESLQHSPDLLVLLAGNNEFLYPGVRYRFDAAMRKLALVRTAFLIRNKIQKSFFPCPKT